MMAMQHANGKWKKLLPPIGKDNKLLKARQQPKHRKNGIDDNNNTNNINSSIISGGNFVSPDCTKCPNDCFVVGPDDAIVACCAFGLSNSVFNMDQTYGHL
eukprot:297244_1